MAGGAERRGTSSAARPHLAAAFLLGLCVFGYLWPVLVGGKILSPIADLYLFAPWQTHTPHDIHHYLNPLLLDLPVVDYPWRFLVRELIREGTFPAWNPYALGGIPLLSNPQTGLFSLFNLPLWILPLTYGLGVSAALKLLAAAFGMYLLVRQLRLGFLPGLLAGVAFTFSAVNITWLAHETLPGVVVMLPWAVLFVERIFERARVGDAIALAIALAIGLGGGHPGMQVHLMVVTGAYVLLRAAFSRRGAAVPRALLLAGGGLFCGALLMAFMLIPEARSTHDTLGVLARKQGSLPGANLPFTAIKTVLFPDWWGRPNAVEMGGFANFCERTFYAGGVALLLACIGLVSPGNWRRKLPAAVVGLLGLATALGAPGLSWLMTHAPVLDSVESQRIHFAFAFAVGVLAAFGLQALLDAPAKSRWRLAVIFVALLGGTFALTHTGARPGDAAHTVRHFLTGADFPAQGVLALTASAWFLLLTLGVGALLLLARLRPRWRVVIASALVLLAVGDAYHFVHGFQPMGLASQMIPPKTGALAYLERRRDDGRILGIGGALPPDAGLVYGLRDVRGYDPPQPTRRMLALWHVMAPNQLEWTPLAIEGLPTAEQMHILGMLGARYLLAPPDSSSVATGSHVLSVVYEGADATVIANAEAAPRVLVPAAARVTSSERATRAAIAERRFDPRTTVAVERDQPGVAALARSPTARGSATIVRDQNSSVTLHAQLDRRGLVVLGDDFTEGWSVRVDGRPAPALHVNDVMRGVIVPAGEHEVVWSYAVPGLRLGALLSLITLAVLIAYGIALGVVKRAH